MTNFVGDIKQNEMFTLNKAYTFLASHKELPKDPIWHRIWTQRHWPKVAQFLWLITRRKVLS